MSTSPRAARRRAALAFVAVAGVDQLTKALIRGTIRPGEHRAVLPGIDLVHVTNRGVAFGFLAGGGPPVLALTGLALGALAVYFARHPDRPLLWLPTGLLLGGAIGNLVDRLRTGAVTDFIDLPLWPAFNAADTAITFGVVILIYVLEGPSRRRA